MIARIIFGLALLNVLFSIDAARSIAHDQVPGAPQTKPILIRGATICPVDREPIFGGSLLFAEGKIIAIGDITSEQIDGDYETIDANGKYVYPGLIAGMSEIGLREAAAISATNDGNEIGDTNPNVRSWVAVNPDSELIPVARSSGVLIAHVAPTGRRLRGQSAVMQLDGWTAAEMKINGNLGFFIDWQSFEPSQSDDKSRREQRKTALKDFDELLDAVKRYAARAAEPAANSPTFQTDVLLESLIPLINGKATCYIEANDKAAIESAVAFAIGREMRPAIYGGADAVQCAALLIQYDIPVIIPGTFRTPQHRYDAYDDPYTLPARLHAAGVRFCISGEMAGYPGGATNLRNLPYQAAHAVAFGLAADVALRSITLSAAEILGVDKLVGSLTIGKQATLVICDGDILQVPTQVTHAWIQGRRVDLRNHQQTLYEKYQQKYKGL